MRSGLTAVFVAAICALALAACGGDDDGEAAAGDGPSKAVFVKKANAVCRPAFTHINETYGEFSRSGENTATEAERNEAALEIVPPTLIKMAADLRALEPPSADEQRIDRMLLLLEEGIEEGERDPLALRGLDGFVFEDAYAKLWAYGLTGCGLGG